jgi:hypothetical protein
MSDLFKRNVIINRLVIDRHQNDVQIIPNDNIGRSGVDHDEQITKIRQGECLPGLPCGLCSIL